MADQDGDDRDDDQEFDQREREGSAQDKSQLTDTMDRLVQLYDATGRAKEAAELRKEVDARKKSTSGDNPAPEK